MSAGDTPCQEVRQLFKIHCGIFHKVMLPSFKNSVVLLVKPELNTMQMFVLSINRLKKLKLVFPSNLSVQLRCTAVAEPITTPAACFLTTIFPPMMMGC